jgi:DNA-binding response OmpR family regulator
MNTEIVSIRLLLVAPLAPLRALLRQGAGMASVPAEVMEAESAAAAEPFFACGIDLVLLDSALPAADKGSICKTARAAGSRPLVIALGNEDPTTAIDGSVGKPATAEEATKAVEGCIRARLPTRALIVDDSSTMRGIVRKILAASKFPLEVADTENGVKALQLLRGGRFDMVFLDCNMPGLDGFEILSDVQRLPSPVAVVMMTSTDNPALAAHAGAVGAAGFLKKPFYPADVDAVLYRLCGIDAPPRPR